MLAIAPIVILFWAGTAAFAFVVAREAVRRKAAPPGLPTTPKEGDVVKITPVGGDWIVKVFREHAQFSVDVIYNGVFQIHKGGFGSIDDAEGWGVNYAKERGA